MNDFTVFDFKAQFLTHLTSCQVAWDEKFPEHAELAAIFGFRNVCIGNTVRYQGTDRTFTLEIELIN